MAMLALHHLAGAELREVREHGHVEAKHLLDIVHGHVEKLALHAIASIVDQDVERDSSLLDGAHHI